MLNFVDAVVAVVDLKNSLGRVVDRHGVFSLSALGR